VDPPPVVHGLDARVAAEEALAHGRVAAEEALADGRVAVWVGPTGSAAYREFVAEVARPRPG
jgi:hypothetical protein